MTHYEQYAKVVGDTLFEAKVKAERLYGKENFTVITTKKIKHSIYLGFGYKEMVEITIGIVNNRANKNVVTEVPIRPSPSVELSAPRTSFSTFSDAAVAAKPTQAAAPKATKTIADKVNGMKAYTSAPHPASMRNVHGLRSNQEGNDEPQPQKLLSGQGINQEQIEDILSELLAVKETRKRREKIAGTCKNTPGHMPVSQAATPASPVVTPVPSDKLNPYEERLNQIFSILNNLNQRIGNTLQKEIPDMPEGLFQVKKNLLEIETPLEIADQLVFELRDELPQAVLQKPEEALKYTSRWLEKTIRFSPDPEFKNRKSPKIIALIGPTGVGKTTTIAKIAASYGLNFNNRLSIALFTLDTYRIGAADQLQQYAQIIDVDMEIVYNPEDIDAAVERHNDKDLIIIDTAGRCQKDATELRELRNFLDRLPKSDKYLVLSATTKYTDMLETVQCFDRVGFDHIIFTKTDETNTFGPLLAVLVKTKKSLAYITNGQKVPDDFRKADFNFFNSHLFPRSAKRLQESLFSGELEFD